MVDEGRRHTFENVHLSVTIEERDLDALDDEQGYETDTEQEQEDYVPWRVRGAAGIVGMQARMDGEGEDNGREGSVVEQPLIVISSDEEAMEDEGEDEGEDNDDDDDDDGENDENDDNDEDNDDDNDDEN